MIDGDRSPEDVQSEFSVMLLDSNLRPSRTLIDTTVITAGQIRGLPGMRDPFRVSWHNYAFRPGLPLAWTHGDDFQLDYLDLESGRAWQTILKRGPNIASAEVRDAVMATLRDTGVEQEVLRALAAEPVMAQIGDMLWDDRGRLWVMRHVPWQVRHDTYSYDVFDQHGTWLFRQALPGRPGILEADTFYAGGELPDGTPVIRSWRLSEGHPGG